MANIKLTIIGIYNFDNTLFSGLSVPDGINKDNLIFNILERAGDLPLLYPDGDFMKTMINLWSANEASIWQKMYDSTKFDYDPIENYNRYDEVHREAEGTSEGLNTAAQTAFNSDSFKDTGRNVSEGGSTGKEDVTSHMHGNIGVTSTMELINQYRETEGSFNIYDFITRSFIDRFCIELY